MSIFNMLVATDLCCCGHIQTEMSAASYHQFYAKELCKAAPGSSNVPCTGIVIDAGAFIGTHSLILAKMGFETHGKAPFVVSILRSGQSVMENPFVLFVLLVVFGCCCCDGIRALGQ